jgi:hypothetical protein
MANYLNLSFRKDIQISQEEGTIYLQSPAHDLILKEFSSGIQQVVRKLASGRRQVKMNLCEITSCRKMG